MNKRYDVLDGFRGIAALMVAIYHLHVSGIVTELNFVRNSYLFVEFFFVLSGFVIASSYIGKLNDVNDLKAFMKKRFARLWPLHIFMTILFIPFAFASVFFSLEFGDRFSLFSFFTNVLLIQSLNLNNGSTWNIPAWSISVEFYTYFVFCIFYIFSFVKKSILIPIFISIISLVILYFKSSMDDTTHYAIFRCTYSFFLGVLALKVHHLLKVKPWMEVAVIGIIVLLLSSLRIQGDNWIAFIIPLLFFVTIIIFSHQHGFISKLLLNKYLKYLGLLSFSIYLTHAFFISVIKAVSKITHTLFDFQFIYLEDGSRIIDFGLGYLNDFLYIPYLIVVISFSYLTYNFIEKPFQQKINRM